MLLLSRVKNGANLYGNLKKQLAIGATPKAATAVPVVEFVETTGARRLERLARNGGKRDHNSGEAVVVGTSWIN